MNWLDVVLLIVLGVAAARGFSRGFIIEACSLLGLVVGIWAGVHLNSKAAEWIGLEPDQEVISFIVVFLAVLVMAHFIGRALTKAIDIAQLNLPNKLAGVFFGLLRSAFVLSVLLNILVSTEAGDGLLKKETRGGSMLYEPLRVIAPIIVPALKRTEWISRAINEIKTTAGNE